MISNKDLSTNKLSLVDLDAPPKRKHRTVAKQDPIGHTYKWLRGHGYVPVKVEHYDVHANRKFDFLGIIDIIALGPTETLGVQVCGADFSSHVKKILESDGAPIWLSCPDRKLLLIGWRYLGGKITERLLYFTLNAEGKVVTHE